MVSVGPDLELTGVGGTLESDSVSEGPDGAVGVLPIRCVSRRDSEKKQMEEWTYQTAEVIRGIRSCSGILLSSTGTLDSCPGAS